MSSEAARLFSGYCGKSGETVGDKSAVYLCVEKVTQIEAKKSSIFKAFSVQKRREYYKTIPTLGIANLAPVSELARGQISTSLQSALQDVVNRNEESERIPDGKDVRIILRWSE